MKLAILKRNKRIEIEKILEKNYGIKIPFKYQLVKLGKEKLRIFTGNLGARDILILSKILTIDTIGLYFAFFKDDELRISFDSAILFGRNAINSVSLNDREAKEWLRGQDLEKNTQIRGYVVIKYNDNILGCGKATGRKILNFVPKERRII